MIILPSTRGFSTYNPRAEIAEFGTKRSSGTFGALSSFYVGSSTGYFKINWWDGTSNSYSHPVGSIAYANKAIVAPYNTTAEKRFSIIPTDSSGRQTGKITLIYGTNNSLSPLSYIDIKGLSGLASFVYDAGTNITSYVYAGRVDLFSLSNTAITSISFPAGSLSTVVKLSANSSLTTVSGLDNLKNRLVQFNASYTSVTSLDFSNFSQLYHIDLRGSPITSLRAQNCVLNSESYSSYSYFFGGANLASTNLDRTALVQFFNDLANGNGYINVSGATGATSLTPTDILIATAKGYTVLGGGI